MKVHFIKRPMYREEVATPACSCTGLVVTPFGISCWGGGEKELQSHWHRNKVTCESCKRTKLFRRIK